MSADAIADLISRLGVKIQRQPARLLMILRLGLIGSTQTTPDGWLRGRIIPTRDIEGMDVRTAVRNLRYLTRKHEWPIRIVIHTSLGCQLEAAPWWAGLRPHPRETRMKYLFAAKSEDGKMVPPVSMHEVTGQLADGRLVGNTRPIAVFYDLSLAERVRDLLDPVHAGAKDKPNTVSDEAGIEPDTLAGDAGAMG